MKWFRMYVEARNDAKLRTLSAEQFRVWFNLLCLAAEPDAVRGVIADCAGRLLAIEAAGGNEKLLAETLSLLEQLQIIAREGDTIIFLNFAKRQYDKPSNTPERVRERVRRHRGRDSNASVTPCNASVTPCNASVTPCNASKSDHHVTTVTRGNAVKRAVTPAVSREDATRCDPCNAGNALDPDTDPDTKYLPQTPPKTSAAAAETSVGGGWSFEDLQEMEKDVRAAWKHFRRQSPTDADVDKFMTWIERGMEPDLVFAVLEESCGPTVNAPAAYAETILRRLLAGKMMTLEAAAAELGQDDDGTDEAYARMLREGVEAQIGRRLDAV